MRIGAAIGNLFKAAIVVAAVYAFLNWETLRPRGDETSAHAEQRCVREIGNRFTATSVKAYAVDKVGNGYVVRASINTTRGGAAKIYCLTNEHGGVEEIRIEER